MASDFSSGCTDAADVLDEKEEGELSLEDVSSSEEGHPHYGSNSRNIEQCPGCSSTQHCASWCTIAARTNRSRALQKKDAVQGKENRHHSKGTELSGGKHTISTLQEKNDDLIPISSDSDMELVGLAESSVRLKSSKLKKKKKKRRPRSPSIQVDEVPPSTHGNLRNINIVRHNPTASKENRLLKKHHREKSPASKTRTSPRRHRSSPVRARPIRKNIRSPAVHTKSEATRKSSRRLKSPRRSPHRTLANPLHKRVRRHSSPSKFVPSPPSDLRFTKLLKKVRQLDMVGTVENDDKVSNKTKEHGSSLKEKLSNILKTTSETSEVPTSQPKENSTKNKKKEKREEEDDLNTLRQKALETKQNKTKKTHESLNTESDVKGSSNNEDDDDEDLQLRLIALRSAVYKKHHNRIQRREKASKRKSPPKRTESPFSDSFINIVTDVENDGSPSASPKTSSLMKDCMSLEDMELDSDLERGPDLDDAPYSPTDEVNNELISEAEQLGLDASDVSLININSRVRFSSPLTSSERESTPSIGTIFCGSSYSTATSNSDPKYPNSESTFSLESPPKDPHSRIPNGEKPYSPSDTPVYDPDLSDTILPQNGLNSCFTENLKYVNNLNLGNLGPVAPLEIDKINLSTNGTISIDDFLDTDLDGSPLVPMEKDSGTDYNIPEHLSYQMLQPSYQPLYLSNTPNAMNDINQMPTLISNPFIPASISRLNILHQEPKKPPLSTNIQKTQETLFHSTSDLEILNTKVLSKPIKPASLAKKQDALTPEIFDQIRGRSMPNLDDIELDKRVETNGENNLSVNTPEEKFSDSSRKRKKARRRRRRNSKKGLSEPEQITSPQDQGKSAKRVKISKTESKNVDVGKSKDSVEKNLERDLETNVEKNSDNSQQRQYNRYNNNNIIIIQSTDTQTTNGNDGQLSLPKNNIKNMGFDSASFKEIRRRSIEEDEEALRASLIASLASRTKAGENVEPKPVTSVPKIVETIGSKSAKPVSKIAETVPSKSINSVSKIAETLPAKPAALVPKVSVSPKTSNATLNKPTENIQIRQTNSLLAGPKENIILNSSVDSAVKPAGKVLVNNSGTTNSILGKRRSSLVQVTSPKKIMRKTIIPASIKVVNNAKRYQNSLIQKRLNLQKANSVFNARKVIANRSLRVLNRNQSARSISPNVSASKSVDRIVINLELDTESETDFEDDSVAVARKSSVERSPLKIPTTEFERSVEQFLRDVRQKQELAAASKPTNITLVNKQAPHAAAKTPTNKGKTTLPATPLAVRHLPVSKQEEYHRLKQEILEREQLKLQRTSGSQQPSNTNTVTPLGPLSPTGSTASTKQKAVSTVVTSNLPKVLSSLSPSKNSSNKQNSAQGNVQESNLPKVLSSLSPSKNSSNKQNSAQGNVQENSQDQSKKAMPKLRILTCEQVNMKFLQVQLNQNESRKVIMGGTNSPQKNILSAQRSERVNQNMSQKEVIEIESSINTNENLMTNKDSSKASTVTTSKSKGVDKTYDSEASTVILSNNDATLSNESRVNKSIDSETSTLVLSQSSTTVESEEKSTSNSTMRTSVLNQRKPVDLENATTLEISEETPERRSVLPSATSTVLKAPVVKEVILTMESTIFKEPTLTKASTIPKEPGTAKASTVLKELPILNPPTGKTTVNSETASATITSKSSAAADTDKIMPSTSKENIKEKSLPRISGENLNSKDNTKKISALDKKKSVPGKSGKNLKCITSTQNASKVDNEKLCAVWNEIRDDVMSEKEKISMLDKEEQKRKLLEAEQNLVAKRYVVLDDLAEVSGSLRQWELEKDLQANLTLEVRKLREQLREAEEKLKAQKARAALMGLKVAAVHENMNVGRKECYKLAKICNVLGTSIVGKKYKIPEAGVQLVNNRLKEVAQHTSQLCKKKNEMKSKTVSTKKSENKESEVTSDEREDKIERQNSCESLSSCEKDSHSVSSDVENNQGDPQRENEPSDSQVSEITPLGCNSDYVSQHIVQESGKEKENESEEHSKDSSEKGDNNKNNRNTDSSSMDKEYSESVMCHTIENSTQNQSTKSDKQSSKQAVRPYESILTHLKSPRSSQPDGILCPYQLRGSCHDQECQFVHHPSH